MGWTDSPLIAFDLQFADAALTRQLALVVLERSDSLYRVPQYQARVHRWAVVSPRLDSSPCLPLGIVPIQASPSGPHVSPVLSLNPVLHQNVLSSFPPESVFRALDRDAFLPLGSL